MRKRELKKRLERANRNRAGQARMIQDLQGSLSYEIVRRVDAEAETAELRKRVDNQRRTITKMQDERRETLEDHAALAGERSEAWRQLRLIKTAMRVMSLGDFSEFDAEKDDAVREVCGMTDDQFGIVVLEKKR